MGKLIKRQDGMGIYEDVEEIVVGRAQIAELARDLGRRISQDYSGKDLLMVGVLTGAAIFLSDLAREVTIPLKIDFIAVSSYGSDTLSTGVVKLIRDVDINICGKDVLIVEDLVDTGLTLKYIKELYGIRAPASLKLCTAFDKISRRKTEIVPEYGGISIPDRFVVGYGLDFRGRYRNLPDLCVLKPEIYGDNCV